MTGKPDDALRAIFAEKDRQVEDARESFARVGKVAAEVAASMRRTGRLVLLGMGGSHAVNRVAEPLYRHAGIDASALPASEILQEPVPSRATVLLSSQSGESGEIVAYLGRNSGKAERFGLTLSAESTLARAVPCLVGHGGMEQAFAATRSLYVSLALHARVLHELGPPQEEALARAMQSRPAPIEGASALLSPVNAVIFSGRGAMQGIAEAAALSLLELAHIPAMALEGGQLRHGPVEALTSQVAVVFIRQAGSESTASLAEICAKAGSPTIVFDLSGDPPIRPALTIALPKASGMEAALTVLPTLQSFIIETARGRVADVGVPIRSTKVTRET